ncbi:MAG TPA: hypothetical protein VMW01_12770 [Williamwhitmania sp.]|nr:hypothetical protein [Williamwhitmania sp.]
MANINRHNYRTTLIDFSEGRLSEREADELLAFMEENHDLLDEYLSMSNVDMPILSQGKDVFTEKVRLKKVVFVGEEFDEFSWLCVARLEGDASNSELSELKRICEKPGELSTEAALFERVKLLPENISYPYKKSLKRFDIVGNQHLRWYYAAASVAAVLLIFTIPVWRDHQQQRVIASASAPIEQNLAIKLSSKSSSTEVHVDNRFASNRSQSGALKIRSTRANGLKMAEASQPNLERKAVVRSDIEVAELSPITPKVVINNPSLLATTPRVIKIRPIEVKSTPANYQTVGEFLAEKVSNAAGIDQKQVKKAVGKARAWEYAQASISGIARIFGFPVKVDKQYDAEGNLKKISIDTKLLAISKTL